MYYNVKRETDEGTFTQPFSNWADHIKSHVSIYNGIAYKQLVRPIFDHCSFLVNVFRL